MNSPLVLGLLLLASTCSFGQNGILRSDVERVERALAHDSLMGRASFTHGNDIAARFLADEFGSIGLITLESESTYQQPFSVYSIRTRHLSISMNGKELEANEMFATSGSARIEWNEGSGIAITYIGPEENARLKLSKLLRKKEHALIVVAKRHREIFQRYLAFVNRGSVTLEPEKEPTIVVVLADSMLPRSLSVKLACAIQPKQLQNVVGVIRGKRTNEIVVFSAHYDHLGIIAPVDGDSIANGANDDASGATAVTSLARYFKSKGRPERTLMFVAFAAEEIGGYGSKYFSRQLDPSSIVAMFNLEMIGKPSKFGAQGMWLTGFERSSLGTIMQKALEGTPYRLYPDPYPDQNLFFRSDNATLARLGVPAHSISTTQIDIDKDYHTVADEVESLDLEAMTNIIQAIGLGAQSVVDGIETPSRIKMSSDE